MSSIPSELRDQINKRLTLNLLIQGSAQHAFLTAHYLVRDELNAIHPDLLLLYDKFALAAFVQYWYGSNVVVSGHPSIFWRRATRFLHPFAKHPLLAKHGLALSNAAKHRALGRCREKGVKLWPLILDFQTIWLINRIMSKEIDHVATIESLAKRVTSMIWGIEEDRLEARWTRWNLRFAPVRFPTNPVAAVLRLSAAGYGGVVQRESQLHVIGSGWIWPIVTHELVKGTAELICLHGLNELDDETYRRVVRAADRIEFEPWMLQVGSELWRRLLPLLPDDRPLAEVIMRVARLAPRPLDSLMLAIVEEPESARDLLRNLPP